MDKRRIFVAWPTVPANNATIVLFATHDRAAGGSGAIFYGMTGEGGKLPIDPADVESIDVTFLTHNKASAANGLRVYALDNASAWNETDLEDDFGTPTIGTAAPVQIPALATGRSKLCRLVVGHLRGSAVEYTAGADNPENWSGTIALRLKDGVTVR